MFSATRLHVFVCLALGIAVQAAPSGAAPVEIAARHDHHDSYDNGYQYDNDEDTIFTEGLNGDDGLGAIDDALDGLDGDGDSDLFKRTALNNILGQLGLSGNADASTGTSGGLAFGNTLSGLGVGDLLSGTNVGANVGANVGVGGSAMRRELLDGLLSNLNNGLGLSGSGSASASASDSGDGLLDNLDLGSILNGASSLGANVGLDTSLDRRQILENIFGQGSDLLNEFGLGDLSGLSGDASTSTDTSTDGMTTDDSTDDSSSGLDSILSGSGLGSFGVSSGTDLGTSFGLRSDVEKRQILENLGLGTNFDLNALLSQLGFFNTNALVTASVSNGATVSVTATPTATGTLSIPTGTLSITTTPTTASATAGATTTATANTNGLASLLSQLGLGNGNFGNLGNLGANAGAGVNTNGNLNGLDLSQFGL